MIFAVIFFSLLAAALVKLAGRRDEACDPRLTLGLMVLTLLLPVLFQAMPKVEVAVAETTLKSGGAGFGTVLIWLWAVGFSCFAGRLVLAAAVIGKWRKNATEVGREGRVAIFEKRGLAGPVAAGIFRPVIFLPESSRIWSPAQKEMVLAHESAHHERRDPFWRLLAELVRAVFWFLPWVHWMARRFTLQSECACDARVLRKGFGSRDYASLLCDFAVRGSEDSLALAMADTSTLEKRVSRICGGAGKKRRGFVILALGLAGVGMALGFAIVRPVAPELPGSTEAVDQKEVELRFSAQAFPGE